MTGMRHIFGFVLLCWLAIVPTFAVAQLTNIERDYYANWLETAEHAETVVDSGSASNATFENLRRDLAGFRETFAQSRSENSERIKTLESQLKALGDKPETGEEPVDIANLRQSLTDQLDGLRVPRVVSEEAYNRADGLIGEIDRIIRDRQAKKLLSRGPSPLDPSFWPIAFQEFGNLIGELYEETRLRLGAPTTRDQIRKNLPAILALLGIGSILLIRGGRWSEVLGDNLRQLGGQGTGVWSFVVSLTKIFLPLIGLNALTAAIALTGILGLLGSHILDSVPVWGATLLGFNWLAYQLYARRDEGDLASVPGFRRAEMRTYVRLLALMLVYRDGLSLYEQIENVSEGSRAVIGFPPILFTALVLLRVQHVGLLIRQDIETDGGESRRRAGFAKMIPVLRRAAVFLGILSPVLAAVGYGHAAEAIVYPSVMTLAVMSLVMVLQRFVGDLYAWLSGKGDAGRDSLFTVLVGFALSLLSLPVLALIWGARVADLTELWAQFLAGFEVGETRISPVDFLAFVFIFGVGYGATRLLQGGLRNSLLPKTSFDAGAQNAIVSGTGYVGVFLAAIVAITGTGLDLSSLAIVAGALSVGIGFGLQTIVSNFVSGIILLIERPISKGDWIEVGGLMGYVRDISVRATRIETFDRTDVIVPNSDLISGTVTNYTRGNTIGRVIAPVGVAYGTDTKRVEKILYEIAAAHPMVLANPAPNIVFQGFGADSLDFEIRAILRDVNWVLSVRSDINHEIARRFAEEGIEIPFAQRDVWLRNPEMLTAPTGGQVHQVDPLDLEKPND